MHLGHLLTDRVYNCVTTKCINDFNRQCNMLFADIKNANSVMWNYLFQHYCTNWYGLQILPIFDDNLNKLCTSWRVAIRRVWRVSSRTYSNLLPHLADLMDPESIFAKRCNKLINYALSSNNYIVRTITEKGLHSSHKIMCANARFV